MAAKRERGTLDNPFSTEGKPFFFDQGVADQLGTCYSCHPGGGPAEGIVQSDGTVAPYDSPEAEATLSHSYDRDFYTYGPNAMTHSLISGKSIEETVADHGDPKRHDWSKSGVMEADCLLCHIDPDLESNPFVYEAADGLKVQPFRPRLMIFAERQNGQVVRVSLGMPLKEGVMNESALSYTNDIQRMSRPIGSKFFKLSMLPKDHVGELFRIWTDGLKAIDPSGESLPYALYGPPTITPHIYTQNGLKDAYTYNPNGGADEMAKLMANQEAIGAIFAQILDYMKKNGLMPAEATMDDLNAMFFNSFVYGYEIRDPGTGQLLPIPFPLRSYEPGKIYTDWDDPNASVRDYVRAPLVEGQGIQYSGLVGLGWAAFQYAYGLIMQGDMTYYDPNAFFGINLTKVIADWENGVIPYDTLKNMATRHDFLPNFFYMMPTAQLMGLDLNNDGMPLSYVQIVKNGDEWEAKSYYNVADLGDDGALHIDMFGGSDDVNSWKWVKVCGQCHVMTQDHGNSEWTRARLYALGMPADWVKNGHFVNFTDDPEASGYDVHMSGKKMGCGSCHLRYSGDVEAKHNFLKGTDTAHMVRNDLDNNPKPRTCEGCHLSGQDPEAPNPTKKHEEKFGEAAGKHIAEIACETCHIPYRRTWRFRAFDDTLGYYSNFDNRFGYYTLMGGLSNFPAMAFPPYYALSPVYGTSPGYGIPHFHMLAQHIDADGNGIQPMDFMAQMVDYFWMNSEADPGQLVNGIMTNPKFDFWKSFYQIMLEKQKSLGVPLNYDPAHDNEVYPPLYWANSKNGYPQIVIGNPITILTWVDANPYPEGGMSALADNSLAYGGTKVLYLREINAAIDKFLPAATFYVYTPDQLRDIPPNDPKWAQDPNVGKVVLKDSGYVIFDHTGDGFPELWWEEDVRAMQEALIKVLKAEGESNPMPMLFMAAHYFSDSHGVQPAEKALGAQSCFDCHGDYTKDPGAHRITDRIVGFLPWAPPWFEEKNRALTFDPEAAKTKEGLAEYMRKTGMVPTPAMVDFLAGKGPDPFFVVDGEVIYIDKYEANGLSILGARQDEILAHSKHHAEELFYMTSEGTITGAEIAAELGAKLTEDELNKTYLKQVVNGPWSDKHYFYVPEEIRPEITELGFQPAKEFVYVAGKGFVEGYILKVGVEGEGHETMFVKLPFQGADPEIYVKSHGDYAFRAAEGAEVLSHVGAYIWVKINEPGEYVAAERGSEGGSPLFQKLWGAFLR